MIWSFISEYLSRDHFVYAPNQWKTMSQCNVVSHRLGEHTKWSLFKGNSHDVCRCLLEFRQKLNMLKWSYIVHGNIQLFMPTLNACTRKQSTFFPTQMFFIFNICQQYSCLTSRYHSVSISITKAKSGQPTAIFSKPGIFCSVTKNEQSLL